MDLIRGGGVQGVDLDTQTLQNNKFIYFERERERERTREREQGRGTERGRRERESQAGSPAQGSISQIM